MFNSLSIDHSNSTVIEKLTLPVREWEPYEFNVVGQLGPIINDVGWESGDH